MIRAEEKSMFAFGNRPFQYLGLAAFAALFVGPPAIAGQEQPAPSQASIPPSQGVVAAAPMNQGVRPEESEAPQTLHLLVGRSIVISSPTRIKRVSLADPTIAEAIVVSPTQVLVNGKTPGGVSLLLWDESDQSQAFEVSVDIDVLGLSQKIHEVFPSEPVQVETSRDVVMLSGRVSSAAVADKILEVVKSATPKVTSLMQIPVAPAGQILLQVRFAEVDRTALSQLGINLFSTGVGKTIGSITTGQFGSLSAEKITDVFPVRGPQPVGQSEQFTTTQTVGDLLNIFLFNPNIHLGAVIKALQAKDLLQILAEPNVLTESGKEASFLAGGEFPFPILQNAGGGGFAGITIQFKEFGVRLNFTPTLTADGLIHLKVKPEVSSLDFSQALTLQGFVIPALSTRRVESEMDLRDGQSFAIAGLVDNRVTEQFQKVPGIGDIPILGKLFQSRTLNKSRNELLIVVTPRVVQPMAADKAPRGPEFQAPFLEPVSPAPAKPAAPK
jgi:pilus assembly protein CpaC